MVATRERPSRAGEPRLLVIRRWFVSRRKGCSDAHVSTFDPDRDGNTRTRRFRVGGLRLERQLEVDFEHVVAVPTTPSTSSGTTADTSPVCQSVNALKSSITALTSPSTLTGGKSSIQAALDAVKTNVDNLPTTVKSGDKPKVEALQSSITDLQTAINSLSGNGISGMTKVATAARNVATSAQALLTALEAGCPSS